MLDKEPRLGLTYDDVVLVPAKSQVLPSEVDMRTRLTRHIKINIPITSSAMDTVTESRLAVAIAREGGIGIIHRVLSPEDQATEVDRVKKSESGMILDPITISPDQTIRDAHALMAKYRISGIPVTKDKKLVGILTNRDLRFETRMDLKVSQIMKRDKLITAPEGTSLEKAREVLHEHRIEKLPVVNKQFELRVTFLEHLDRIQHRLRVPVGGIDHNHVYPYLLEPRHAIFRLRPHTHSRTHAEPAMSVLACVGIHDAFFDILDGNKPFELEMFVDDRKLLDPMLVQHLASLFQTRPFGRRDQFVSLHDLRDLQIHPGFEPQITIRKNTDQFLVFRNGNP